MGDSARINSEGKHSVMLNAVCNEPVSLKVVKEPFYRKGFSPFVHKETGTWWEYDDDKKGFFDTGIIAQGRDGDTVDVQINGESIVQDGVANVPKASEYTFGLVRTQNVDNATRGIYISSEGYLTAYNATTKNVNNRESQNSISPINLDYAVKAAMCDGKGAAWTAEEQAAARDRISGFAYRHIATLEITENVGEIVISNDSNGNSFSLRDVIIKTYSPVNSLGDSSNGYYWFNGKQNDYFGPAAIKKIRNNTTDVGYGYNRAILLPNNRIVLEFNLDVSTGKIASSQNLLISNGTSHDNLYRDINSIGYHANGQLEIGTIFEVWGIDI